MTKLQFLLSLNEKLADLPRAEAEERLNFYCEMIEDRMEEGLSEEDAVAEVGSVDTIAAQIKLDASPAASTANVPPAQKRLQVWQILLLILGAPLWLPLLTAGFAVALAAYVSLWAVVIALWAVFGAVAGCSFGCIAAGIVFIGSSKIAPGIAMLGAGLICAGLSIFLFMGCKAACKGIVLLTKKAFQAVRKKEEA